MLYIQENECMTYGFYEVKRKMKVTDKPVTQIQPFLQ